MGILLIFLGIIVIIVIIAMIKYYTDPEMRKAVDIIQEYKEKEKRGEIIFSEKDGYVDVIKDNNSDLGDMNIQLLIAICTSHVRFGQPPLKVTSLFSDGDIKRNFNKIGYFLLNEKYTNNNTFHFDVDLNDDGKTIKEITISIDETSLKSYSNEIPTNENLEDDDYITSDDLEEILLDLEDYADGDNYIELPIRGINFMGLTESNIGQFDGYIAPDKNNKYDEYAIAIYGNDGVHFGFIEKGQEFLYNKIEDSGGIINVSIDVYPFINDETESRLSGTITIDKEDLI